MGTIKKSAASKKEKVVDVAKKSTSIGFSDNMSTGIPQMNKVVLHHHKGKLHHLDHVSMAPNIVSLWNANLSSPKFVQSFAFLSQTDHKMMDYVGP